MIHHLNWTFLLLGVVCLMTVSNIYTQVLAKSVRPLTRREASWIVSRDNSTGWRDPLYLETTINGVLKPTAKRTIYHPTGLIMQSDATVVTQDTLIVGDQLIDGETGKLYQVVDEPTRHIDSKNAVLAYWTYRLREVPIYSHVGEGIEEYAGSFCIDGGAGAYADSTRTPNSRKMFKAAGRWWVFFINAAATAVVYSTSTDGETWSSPTVARATAADGRIFSVWQSDAADFQYATVVGSYLYYRKGLCNSDGSITWYAAEQLVASPTPPGNVLQDAVSICCDSNGYPWITWSWYYLTTLTGVLKVSKSSTKNGIWTTDTGFPYTFETRNTGVFKPSTVVPLDSGNMCVVWRYNTTLHAMLYSSGSWSSREDIATGLATTGKWRYFSVISIGNDVHVVFLKSGDPYYLRRQLAAGWNTEILLKDTPSGTNGGPCLSRIGSSVVAFWWDSGYCYWVITHDGGNNWQPASAWFTADHYFSDNDLGVDGASLSAPYSLDNGTAVIYIRYTSPYLPPWWQLYFAKGNLTQ